MAEPIIPSDAVQAIKDSVETKTIEVGGRAFVTRPVFKTPAKETANGLRVNTLQGIVDYFKSNVDTSKFEDVILHIDGPTSVSLISGLFGRKQRETYLESSLSTLFGGEFKFGTYLDCETFIIGVRTLFDQNDAAENVIKLVGNLTQGSEQNSSDDGFSQTVTVKAGITRVEKAIVPNPVTLIPFRTFREVEQPSSSFILRLTGGEKPKAALFEADGGQWKLEAIKNIKAFFDGKDLNIPIIC